MRQLLTWACLFLFLLAGAQPLEKTLLWKISGNGLSKPSYLYGTIHVICDNTLDAATQKAVWQTEQLCLELDMDDPSLALTMAKGMLMKDGMTMDQLASAEDFALVNAFFKEKMGFGLDLMKNLKPMMVSMLLLPHYLGCTPKSMEEALMAQMTTKSGETVGLETIAEQMAVFDAIPYQVQMDELVKSAKDNANYDKVELEKMMAVYRSKDLDAMVALAEKSENRTTSDYGDILLHDRNLKWISRIAAISKEKPTFYGVGAAHLGGENGVIRLLRKAGFTVEAVTN